MVLRGYTDLKDIDNSNIFRCGIPLPVDILIFARPVLRREVKMRVPLFVILLIGSWTAVQASVEQDLAKCSTISPTAQRLLCFDQVALALPRSEALDSDDSTTVVDEWNGKWRVRIEKTGSDDNLTVHLVLRAEAPAKGWPDAKRVPAIVVRCRGNETEAYVGVGTPWDIKNGQRQRSTVHVRYDKADAIELQMGQSDDSKGLFFPAPVSHIKQMVKHRRMLFQSASFDLSAATTIFEISGLSNALKPLRKACGW